MESVLFGKLLAEMAMKGHTQKTIAGLIGVSDASISRRFSGEVAWSKPEIDVICEFYHKTYEDLFCDVVGGQRSS